MKTSASKLIWAAITFLFVIFLGLTSFNSFTYVDQFDDGVNVFRQDDSKNSDIEWVIEGESEFIESTSDSFTFKIVDFEKNQGLQTFDESYNYEFYSKLDLSEQLEIVDFVVDDSNDTVDIILKNNDLKSSTTYKLESVFFYYTPKGEEFNYNSGDLNIIDLTSDPVIAKTKMSSKSKSIITIIIIIILSIVGLIILMYIFKFIRSARMKAQDKVSNSW